MKNLIFFLIGITLGMYRTWFYLYEKMNPEPLPRGMSVFLKRNKDAGEIW